MPGTRGGTGQPIWFRCWRARRDPAGLHDRIVRTGRIRYHGKATLRYLPWAYEYECNCGHIGWTRHRDIMRHPMRRTIRPVENLPAI